VHGSGAFDKETVKSNPPTHRPQVTLFHLLWLSFVFFCAFYAGRKLAIHWSKAGWVAGGLIGVLSGFLLLYVLWLLSELYY
jgi:hypothetical protein